MSRTGSIHRGGLLRCRRLGPRLKRKSLNPPCFKATLAELASCASSLRCWRGRSVKPTANTKAPESMLITLFFSLGKWTITVFFSYSPIQAGDKAPSVHFDHSHLCNAGFIERATHAFVLINRVFFKLQLKVSVKKWNISECIDYD